MEQPHEDAPVMSAAGIVAALTHIDSVGFYGMTRILMAASPKVDRNWVGLIWKSVIAVAATDWPDSLLSASGRFTTAAREVVQALDARAIDAATSSAGEMYMAYHALSDAGWAYLAAKAGIEESRTDHQRKGPHVH